MQLSLTCCFFFLCELNEILYCEFLKGFTKGRKSHYIEKHTFLCSFFQFYSICVSLFSFNFCIYVCEDHKILKLNFLMFFPFFKLINLMKNRKRKETEIRFPNR